VSEQWGRRWIGIDTSRVALALARERLLTATYPYYRLADESRDVDGGLFYEEVPHNTLGTFAQDRPAGTEILYDRPHLDPSKVRVSGPFTVEALSRYAVNPTQDEVPPEPDDPQASEAQDHVDTLLDALLKQGIPRKGSKPIPIGTLERIAGTGAIHAEGTYTNTDGKERRFAVSLGPRFGPVTFAQIDDAMEESMGYDLVVFAGFAATAEAQDVIAKGQLGKRAVALLEANPDLLVGDLLKSTPSSQTFRLFSAPEIQLKRDGEEVRVEVIGVDSFDASTGEVTSRGQRDIAAWFLDQDYDSIVFHVTQAFFPKTNGWEALQRALKGTIDPELWEQLESFESLPFEPGEHKKAAVRVVDDSGTTSEAEIDLS
jgi:adenine-specific DNA-methyltransferase